MYAVGTYFDPLAMSMVKSQGEKEVKRALLDPTYPRVSCFLLLLFMFYYDWIWIERVDRRLPLEKSNLNSTG